jgi:hypothetical protein
VKPGWISLALLLTGCVSIPDTYRPPIERKPMVGGSSHAKLREFIEMSNAAAPDHIVNGISGKVEAGAWRWTDERFTLMFRVASVEGNKLVLEFTVPAETFAQTGPFQITYAVNGRVLDKVLYDSPGDKRFEKAVPPGNLRKDAENFVVAELDKAYVAEPDQKRLGVILFRAGFIR